MNDSGVKTCCRERPGGSHAKDDGFWSGRSEDDWDGSVSSVEREDGVEELREDADGNSPSGVLVGVSPVMRGRTR